MSEHNHAFLSAMLSLVLQIQPCQADSETSGWHGWHIPISCIRRQDGQYHLPIVPGETDGELTSRHTMGSLMRKTIVVLFGLLFAVYCAGRKLHAPTQSSAVSVISGR